ncbi:MAG: hypothetical protein A2606_01375 [Candidatus Yanofskybacteria bacterium RIFOXYD1_FULL_42_10]|uniref:Amino acid transporter transmembrane domain-containing protein n=3 Tax=Parcubacteria group TaxID=1794811 RepID=A0A1F8HRM5_9BACT|nr:MAG: Aromatic amino acid permease [Candidatus Jorgensenbacteria bacterium GW2011_GWF2_41_8]KKS27807.1 MAG: Aromatic amino acid permease [Candidatus Yanofskybacteria bacterium GW2011_GWC2_41_9]OGN39778.1 MAG: hypothetical protein A2606_01375 [Candidatus Yanofskybacteria bacterium RIFOXYD1_FULL_42_10]
MIWKDKTFLRSAAVLVGTMVGVGVFGIPFTFAKAGFWVGFLFLIFIAGITLLTDFMYGEIILRTQAKHQLVGYAQIYLGPFFKKAVFFTAALSTYAALLAYIIISGDFLSNIFSNFFYFSPATYSAIFFAVLSVIIFKGIKTVSWVELFLAALFAAVIMSIFIFGIGKINFANFSSVTSEYWFLPYGILLFAFAGLPAVPMQRQLLAGREELFKKSILVSVLLVAILYFIFAFSVLGVSGDTTTPDAISGLFVSLGGTIVFFGSLFGVLAVSTSYLMLGSAFLDIFNLDFGISRKLSWLLVILPPFVLFLGGMRTFIDVISLAGSVGIGVEGVVLVLIFRKSKITGDRIPEYSLKIPRWLLYFLAAVFISGAVYAIFIK